jgi:hypothetical protein
MTAEALDAGLKDKLVTALTQVEADVKVMSVPADICAFGRHCYDAGRRRMER